MQVDMRIMQVMERQQSMTFEDLCAEVQEHVCPFPCEVAL